jgi:hypothetical protein
MEGYVNDFSRYCGKEEYEAIHIYFKGDKGEA